MCTASFLPDATGGYLLAANRDERPHRGIAWPPTRFLVGGHPVLAPRDPDAGGTWIATHGNGTTLCLLNGDRDAHRSREQAPSRGLLVLELLEDPDGAETALEARLRAGRMRENPFRLLIARPRSSALARIEWDGAALRSDSVAGPHVEISNGIDPREAQRRRRGSFEALLRRCGHAPGPEQLCAWHSSHLDPGGAGDAFSVCMHHERASTVSFTLVQVTSEIATMTYRDGPPCEGRPVSWSALERTPSTACSRPPVG